jgi:hypothetical protein
MFPRPSESKAVSSHRTPSNTAAVSSRREKKSSDINEGRGEM